MGFESIFRNRLTRPVARPMLASGGEQTIVWSAEASGLLARLEALEMALAQVQSRLEMAHGCTSVDLDPDPNVDAATGYELASDGALRSYVEITVRGTGLREVALLGAPTVAYAGKDAKIAEDAPTTNYGTASDLVAGQDVDNEAKRTWLQFAWGVYPNGLWAVEPMLAVLRLYKLGTIDDEIALAVDYEDLEGSDWDESGVSGITWNNQPGIDRTISRITNEAGTSYSFFDLTKFFYLVREARTGEWAGSPYGLVISAVLEGENVGRVNWMSKEGASSDDQKPQVWYWTEAEKTQVMGGTVKTAKLYGKPGGTYHLVHRMLDADNNPGRWSEPLEVTLPDKGATPSAPTTPTKVDTLISHFKIICLTTSVPADFDHFHVAITETTTSTVTEFNTRVDRFHHWFPFIYASGGGSYQVKYKIVTRSGVESAYSSALSFSVTSNLKLQSPGGEGWLSLLDTSGLNATTIHVKGGTGDLNAEFDDGSYKILTEKAGEIVSNSLAQYAGLQWTVDQETAEEATSSTSYVDTGCSLSFTTDSGKGESILLLGIVPRCRQSADNSMGYINLLYKIGTGSWTSLNEAQVGFLYSAYGDKAGIVAGHITVAKNTAVYAKLQFKTNAGVFYFTGRHLIAALRAKNNT